MDSGLHRRMRRNIWLYSAYKVFTKRVFLPLTTIYASQVAGLNVLEIGIASASASAASIILETLTGFWADKHGRKRSSQIGALLAGTSTLCYIFIPTFEGILAASIIMAAGYSFMSGAMDALIHDSLIVLGRAQDYAKVASRAQSVSLVVNAFFIAGVPLLYPLDPRLPFVAGTIAYSILFTISTFITEPPLPHNATREEKRFLRTVRRIVRRRTILFFACAGFMYGITNGTSDLLNLGFLELGLRPEHMGMVFAASSLLGAVGGLYVHKLKRLSFRQFATVDIWINLLLFAAFGLSHSLPIAIAVFVINLAFWRFQKIMYQHYILTAYGATRYKATLISVVSNFSALHEVWLALTFSSVAQQVGVLASLSYGVVVLLLMWPLLLLSISQFTAYARASSTSSNQ